MNLLPLRMHNKKSSTQYFAPECFEKQYSVKSDVWALGITIVEVRFLEL